MTIVEETCDFSQDHDTNEEFLINRNHRATSQCLENYTKLQQQRENAMFCDVSLQVQDEKFPAHKAVLAACSDYFTKMFTTDMKEKNEPVINIETVTPRAMKEILSGIYTGIVDLDEENIREVLHAASLMQLDYIINECKDYMSHKLHHSNCCLFLDLAKLYSFEELLLETNAYFLKKFDDVCLEPDFLKLEMEKIKEILASDDLETAKESNIFRFVINWVGEDLQNRKQDFPQLFQHVRLQFIPIEYVVSTIRKNEFVRKFHECRDLVDDAFEYHVAPNVNNAQKHRKCYAPKPDSVMLLPLHQPYQAVYNTVGNEAKHWQKYIFDGFTIHEHCAVASKYPLTVLCGGINAGGTQTTNRVMRFDCLRWMEMSSLSEARCGAAAVFLDNKIIVFGGETIPVSRTAAYKGGQANPDASNFSQTLEKFDHKWETEKFPFTRSYFAAQVFDSKIYLIGGYTISDASEIVFGEQARCKKAVNTVIVFDPTENEWKEDGCMNEARANFGCAVIRKSTVIVVGGDNTSPSLISAEFRKIKSSKVWTMYRSTPCRSSHRISACYVNDKLFVANLQNLKLYSKDLFKNEVWQNETYSPDYGILIPFSEWYCRQSFSKMKSLEI